MRGMMSSMLRCPLDFDGAGFPVADREEFMGRNSSLDAGTVSGMMQDISPDDYFGTNQVPECTY